MGFIALLFGILMLAFGGVLFALPAYIMPIRQRARQSYLFRYGTMMSLSIVTFVVFFAGLAYLNAYSVKISCFGTNGIDAMCLPEIEDEIENLVVRELWIRALIPPPMMQPDTCLNDDPAVCEAVTRTGLANNSLTGYLITVVVMLIPAFSCGFMVYRITAMPRVLRKKKNHQSYL